jgi:hypothetical protein
MALPDIHQGLPEDKSGPAADDAEATKEAASIAAYIADMTYELSNLASRCGMPMLSYFLNLARAEADMKARELGGYRVDRSP